MEDQVVKPVKVNKKLIYPFQSEEELIKYVENKQTILIAIGVEKLLNEDDRLRQIINFNVTYCDGVGAVMALKKKGATAKKIPGSVIWLKIIENFYKTKTVFLIGSTEEVINKTCSKLKVDFPGINIVGFRNGFFKDNEMEMLEQQIYSSKPQMVFVAMGSPKQEYLMDKLLKNHGALYMGLGGSFDLYTGKAKEVPKLWKKIFRWEGIYRSFNEFSNIKRWKRQMIAFKFFYKLWFTKLN